MRIEVRRYRDVDAGAIERFNHRMETGGSEHRLYREDLTRNPNADLEIQPINDSLFVAADENEVRGGSWLRELYFWVDGARQRVGWMKYPVAESLIDQQYAGVPGSMILQLLRERPSLMALGMGGHEAPFARLLTGIKWKSATIPLYFRIVRPYRVLRRLRYARQRRWRRTAMDVAAWTGAGWAANRLFQATSRVMPDAAGIKATIEPGFSPWADAIWAACRESYRALAVRDGWTLDFIYRLPLPDLDRLRVSRDGSDIGWASTQVLPPSEQNRSYFGDLRVGMIVDSLARPEDAAAVLRTAVRHLERRGVDLIITYLSHDAWAAAARRIRFLSGPSTLAFYRSPGADKLLLNGGSLAAQCHLTGSDCHGAAGG